MTLPTNQGLVPPPETPRRAAERRLAAKRFNERMKLVSTTLNAVAVAIFGATYLLPSVAGNVVPNWWIWLSVAAGLHLLSHAVLGLLKSED